MNYFTFKTFSNFISNNMIANPLYSKYKTYKLSPQRSPDEMPSERTRIILGANVGITFTLSLFTYILGFTNFLNYRFSYIVFSNTTTHSILTPPTWAYYIQWINYALLLICLLYTSPSPRD